MSVRNDCCDHREMAAKASTMALEGGSASLVQYEPFEGVTLTTADVTAKACRIPDSKKGRLLRCCYCAEGRVEMKTRGRFYCISDNELALITSPVTSADFPGGRFSGASVLIDLDQAPETLSCLLDGIDVSPARIYEQLGEPCVILRCSDRLRRIFSDLLKPPSGNHEGCIRLKILELMLVINELDVSGREVPRSCTSSQLEVARETAKCIEEDLGVRITIEELSQRLGVSPTRLKMSFRTVFGMPVYTYARTRKMEKAAKLLIDTDRTILDIAGEMGYDNGSKFSKAFADVMGVPPSTYRRLSAGN
ncbi:MAG: helix-turn-helix transcriptional regulator [Ruminococcus sp.]|nr:helix-turn-helix transcriptional regulator [Ruminococcus sp.]